MNINEEICNLIGKRLGNLENSLYIRRAIKKYGAKNIDDLPQTLKISIEREGAYLKGFMDGIRLGRQ